jgi:hypothetical protein
MLNFVITEFYEVRLLRILRPSLPASNAQATAKIAHLSDTPAPIETYDTNVTNKRDAASPASSHLTTPPYGRRVFL